MLKQRIWFLVKKSVTIERWEGATIANYLVLDIQDENDEHDLLNDDLNTSK